jgi:hypothetical protein
VTKIDTVRGCTSVALSSGLALDDAATLVETDTTGV